jgi:hypothetical protein
MAMSQRLGDDCNESARADKDESPANDDRIQDDLHVVRETQIEHRVGLHHTASRHVTVPYCESASSIMFERELHFSNLRTHQLSRRCQEDLALTMLFVLISC